MDQMAGFLTFINFIQNSHITLKRGVFFILVILFQFGDNMWLKVKEQMSLENVGTFWTIIKLNKTKF